jgi:hypothetical protein
MKSIVSAAAAVLVLAGCAGMNESECLTADWQMIGFEDGSVGKSQSNIGEYRKACADHGITPSLTQYQQGYAKGIRNYCAQSNGFDQGKRGATYRGICPSDMEADFVEAYSLGREYYVLSRAVSSLSSKISSGESRIKSLEKSVAQNVLVVADDETSSEERVTLMLRIKDQYSEISELKEKIPDYEDELAHKRAEYASLEQPLFH